MKLIEIVAKKIATTLAKRGLKLYVLWDKSLLWSRNTSGFSFLVSQGHFFLLSLWAVESLRNVPIRWRTNS